MEDDDDDDGCGCEGVSDFWIRRGLDGKSGLLGEIDVHLVYHKDVCCGLEIARLGS